MNKKFFSFLMVITIAFSLLAGCSKTETPIKETTIAGTTARTKADAIEEDNNKYGDTGGLKLPLVDKPVTLTACADTTNPNVGDSWLIKELENRTGIKLELTVIAPTQWDEKTKIMLASGNLTDFASVPKEQINVLGAKGVIVPVNKYADMMPNFKKTFYEKYPWVMKSYTAEDGNLYFYPTFENTRDVNHGLMYRKDIFDKNGIKLWTNTQEFYEALKKLKELYPDSYPWANKYKEQIFKLLAHGWGISGIDFKSEFPMYYDEADGTWKFGPGQMVYKDMLLFMQKLYAEKLLDPEFLTDTAASWTSKMTSDQSMVTWDWIGRLEMWTSQVKDQMPDYDLRYGNPIGPVGQIMKLAKVQSLGHCIVNNDKKEAALKLVDYLASPSGKELMTMGQKGVTYDMDADGSITYVGYEKNAVIGITDLEEKWGLFIQPLYPTMDSRSVYFKLSEREKEAQDMMISSNRIEEQDPILKFTAEEQQKIVELKATLEKATYEFSSKFTLDTSMGDSNWNEWLKKVEELRSGELARIYNTAQKRYNQSN